MLDLQPTLTGALLTLRPLKAEDWPALFAAACDPLIWAVHPEPDRYREEVFRRFFDGALASGGGLAAVENATARIVGSSRFHHYTESGEGEIDIGYSFLVRRLWGGNYNREMKGLMLGHALQSVGRARFVVGVDNHRSRRAMEKIGGVETGPGVDAAGNPCVVFVITRASFGAGPLAPFVRGAGR